MLLAGFAARAQFFSSGDDPGGVRWSTVSSGNFRIIYPAGCDSLALRYGLALEKYAPAVGAGIGYGPNAEYRRPLPVILHPFSAVANGSVAWAPRRMDLFTRPESLSPESTEWITELAVHESRHSAQMQFARERGYGLFNLLSGNLFTGAMSALYPGPALLEGDAVATETALTAAGRGRSADFLEHYRVSFSAGDFRNWYRWRWGSLKTFTPDHYRAGYMLVAGVSSVYDDPDFTGRYYRNVTEPFLPFPLFVLRRTVKQASGMGLKGTWKEIASAQQALWAADEAARGPFTTARQLTPARRRYTEYTSPEAAGDAVYAVRRGITSATQLVRLKEGGRVSAVRPFATSTSQIRYSDELDRLFWSERVVDHRWTLKSDSRIFYLVPGKKGIHRLTSEGNLSNPSPAPDGSAVSVTEYPVRGGSAVRVIDGLDGRTLQRYPAPDSLQVVETAWVEGRPVASAISPGGFGFYDVTDGFRPLTAPVQAKFKQLRSTPEGILFVSDASGVNELYRLGAEASVVRLTNNRFGASDFLPSGDSLTFAALSTEGRLLYREPLASAERLVPVSLGASPAVFGPSSPAPEIQDGTGSPFSAPRPYRKLLHLLRLHSWAPLYIDYDAVSNFSFETLYSSASPGAMLFLQNDLGTASAIVGYSLSRETVETEKQWNHTFHARFTYRGLYPVIELGTDIGNRKAVLYHCQSVQLTDRRTLSLQHSDTDLPYYRINAKAYIPWDFSRGGWYRGVVPSLSLQFSNDVLYTGRFLFSLMRVIGDEGGVFRIHTGAEPGRDVPVGRATASLRAYTMLGRASSAIYPRWGIGAESGYSLRPGSTSVFSPVFFAYVYGYVPGLMPTHGLKLSAALQTRTGNGIFPDGVISFLPRGISGLQSYLQSRYDSQTKISADYALPLLPLDWSGLCPLAYVRNLELTLHADCTLLGRKAEDFIYSAGADLTVRLGNLLWVPYATRIGVSWNFNGTTIGDALSAENISIPKHHFGLILSVDLP